MVSKNNTRIIALFLFLIAVFGLVGASRLPTSGGDTDTWGTILNDYLSVALNSSSGYLKEGSVNATFLGVGNLTAGVFATGSINTSHILNDNITLADMAADSVNATHIVSGGVGTAEIAGQSVGLDDMAADSVNATHLVDSSVGQFDYAPQSINSTHLNLTAAAFTGVFNATHMAASSVNSTHVVSAGNFTFSGINVSTQQGGNQSNTTRITKMKIVTNIPSSGNSTLVLDGDVATTSMILLTMGVDGLPARQPCIVANLSRGAFNVTCYPVTGSLGSPVDFLFNYMVINPA